MSLFVQKQDLPPHTLQQDIYMNQKPAYDCLFRKTKIKLA